MELKDLKKKIPFKWRIGQVYETKQKASCLAYIDARDAMDVLDEVVGAENWQTDYKLVGENLMCGVSIKVNDEWVTKWDTGVSGNFEEEKSQVSDSFKRACVHWGIGRFLYSMKMEFVDVRKFGNNWLPVYPHNEERIYDLTEYINSKTKYKK